MASRPLARTIPSPDCAAAFRERHNTGDQRSGHQTAPDPTDQTIHAEIAALQKALVGDDGQARARSGKQATGRNGIGGLSGVQDDRADNRKLHIGEGLDGDGSA